MAVTSIHAIRPSARSRTTRYRPKPARLAEVGQLHSGNELLDPFVDGPEGIFTENSALGLIVQLEVHPVDREVPAPFLRSPDEVTAQPSPGRLRRNRLGFEDRQVAAQPLHRAAPLQQV